MNIALSEVIFVDQLKRSPVSCVFRTIWRGKDCVLKVPLLRERRPRARKREIDPFKCESAAFIRLQEHGLCDRGYVPEFYGLVEQIKPADYLPHLKDFLQDTIYPNAVLMEYIPDIQPIDLSTFSEQRIHQLHQILREIHSTGVHHGDPYPRNMMVQTTSDRVSWIDFDRAQTFTPQSVQPYQLDWLDHEKKMMEYFVEALMADAKIGRIDATWICYYDSLKPPREQQVEAGLGETLK
ncbi:uncharacterized protein BO80DRAFT_456602 [Aspergillus ibericus CBS 121593]|uniref:Protein kinase domain-containing protein n=1 Tax=Aspergillus ibericus CBS 121593 TaxID=1448316 RepID=A0A395GUP7_9EURO|nr:hypothetical protein BO80DRAFT_456602 [Aspergillus ibericus CBS 121593]RAK99280.1 hypothetical protein BO80DRAFT_456602 [Aspergillus ibericus CBS 121593]